MALTLEDLLESVRNSHKSLFRHLKGITEEQLTWKPYPECKSIHETLAHLIAVEWSSQSMLNTGEFPDYETHQRDALALASGKSPEELTTILKEEQDKTLGIVAAKFKDTALDEEIKSWGYPTKMGEAIVRLGTESTYHSGQIAYIRMATDPSWDYYKEIYFSD